MAPRDSRVYLTAADEMLGGGGALGSAAVAGGWWPKACACLIRLGLEAAIDEFWLLKMPEVAVCTARRTQLLMLRRYAGKEVARRASYAWATLSRLSHYQCYDTMPTAEELRRMHKMTVSVVGKLATQPQPQLGLELPEQRVTVSADQRLSGWPHKQNSGPSQGDPTVSQAGMR